jgi:hypothetical protein
MKEEVTGGWRKLQDKEHVMTSKKVGRTYGPLPIREMRNAYILIVKPEVKTVLRRRRCKRKKNTKTNLKEINYDGVDQIKMAADRFQWRSLVDTYEHSGFHKRAGIS